MGHSRRRITPFAAQGQFLGFLPDSEGKAKYFELSTPQGSLILKVPKALRPLLRERLHPGVWVMVNGDRKLDDGQEKWIAYRVEALSTEAVAASVSPALLVDASPAPPPPASKSTTKTACAILICEKSDCRRRGSQAIREAIEGSLQQHPQANQIRVQSVGCMKDCKIGPNLVFMPDKARYHHVSPQGIPTLLERHFPLPDGADPQPLP